MDFALNIIPSTVVGAFTSGDILQVLLFSILFGAALAHMGSHGRPLVDLIEQFSHALFGVVRIIMYLAPLGAFGAISFAIGTYGLARWCRWASSSWACGSPRACSCSWCWAKLENLGCAEGVVGLTVPTGYSFNLAGSAVYLTRAAVFIAQATNTPLHLGAQIGLLAVLMLTSKGAASVSGAGFVTLAATISSTGALPIAGLALLLGVDRFLSESRAVTNLIGNGVAGVAVACWQGSIDRERTRAVLAQGREVHA